MAEISRKRPVGRLSSNKLPGRRPMTRAEFENWLEQHSPSKRQLSTVWRSVGKDGLPLRNSSVKRLIGPELQ